MNIVAIIGSRDFKPISAVDAFVATLAKDTVIVTGGAWNDTGLVVTATRGVDRAAAEAGRKYGLVVVLVAADWQRFGKSAGMRRNPTIVSLAERVVAFWDGRSAGTKSGVDLARNLGKYLDVFTETEENRP